MLSNTRVAILASVGLGLALGVSFGFGSGALMAPPILVGLLWLLGRSTVSAALAGLVLATFAFGLLGAGHLGFALGVPSEVRALATLPLAILVLAFSLLAGVSAYIGFAACHSPAARITLVLPSIWTLQEWLFSLSDVAVPWIRLGYSQAAGGLFAGAFPLGGVLLVGWLMLSACGVAALLLRAQEQRARLAYAALLLALVSATPLLSHIEWTRPAGSLNVDLVQSGMPSKEKFEQAATANILGFYRRALESSTADLIVTPQLAIPKTADSLPVGYLAGLQESLQHRRADALLGIHFGTDESPQLYNGVLALGQSGWQRHLKHHVFPFGEAIPLSGRSLEWVQSLLPSPMLGTMSGPASGESLRIGVHRIALAICFEAAFADTWREQAATATLLANLSSDSAIDSRQLARQFKLVDQARALEFQKPLVRTSDVRGTYFIDASGQVSGELPEGASAVAHGVVLTRIGLTPYARFGDRLALFVSVLGLCAASLLAWRRRPLMETPAAPSRPRHRTPVGLQSGQILPVATVLLLIIGGMFYLMVNAGQSVTEKIRVTNAADAAAYSAGVVEARALNYDAYLNRAMVANQIAIAQMVSFASWANYFATAADNFGANMADVNFFLLPNPKVLVLDVAFGGSAIAAAYFGGRTVQDYADYIVDGAGVIITAHDLAESRSRTSRRVVMIVAVFR